jgi:carbon storage regulator
MLVITRQIGEEIIIGDNIRVVLLKTRGEQARIGIDAPRNILVDRSEVKERRTADAYRKSKTSRMLATVSS